MIYSVWNIGTRQFDYYQSGNATGTHAGAPPTRMFTAKLGATPDQAAWPLPSDAVHVGSGRVAKGRIATKSAGLLGLGADVAGISIPGYLILGGLVYCAWRVFQ